MNFQSMMFPSKMDISKDENDFVTNSKLYNKAIDQEGSFAAPSKRRKRRKSIQRVKKSLGSRKKILLNGQSFDMGNGSTQGLNNEKSLRKKRKRKKRPSSKSKRRKSKVRKADDMNPNDLNLNNIIISDSEDENLDNGRKLGDELALNRDMNSDFQQE